MSPLGIQLDRIRRGGWLVVLLAVVGALFAGLSAIAAGPTYTGRATLTVASPTRAPEQDSVLAQGYVEYFNETSYQQKLRTAARLPAGVTLSARLAAASPIIYVEATAKQSDTARLAASAMAAAFRSDVNASIQADHDSRIADLGEQITQGRLALYRTEGGSKEAALASQALTALQTQIDDLRADSSNQLQELQVAAVVSGSAPSLVTNVALGLVGGLIVGVLAALALAALRRRVTTAAEVRDQLGINVLGTIRGGPSVAARHDLDQSLKRVANLVGLSRVHRPAIIAVTAPRRTSATGSLADAVATRRAEQGERTLLIRADLHGWPDAEAGNSGVSELLAHGWSGRLATSLLVRPASALRVLPPGGVEDDPYRLFAPERWRALLAEAADLVDLVVVEVPALLDAAEAQVICAAAHATVLVVEAGVVREPDAQAALRQLRQVDQAVLGAVLVHPGTEMTPGATAWTGAHPETGVGRAGGLLRRASRLMLRRAPGVPEPVSAVPEPVPAEPEPVPAASEPLSAAPEPVPAAPEPVSEAPDAVPAARPRPYPQPVPVPEQLGRSGVAASR